MAQLCRWFLGSLRISYTYYNIIYFYSEKMLLFVWYFTIIMANDEAGSSKTKRARIRQFPDE